MNSNTDNNRQVLFVVFYNAEKKIVHYAIYENVDQFIEESTARHETVNYETWSSVYLPEGIARETYKAGMELLGKKYK